PTARSADDRDPAGVGVALDLDLAVREEGDGVDATPLAELRLVAADDVVEVARLEQLAPHHEVVRAGAMSTRVLGDDAEPRLAPSPCRCGKHPCHDRHYRDDQRNFAHALPPIVSRDFPDPTSDTLAGVSDVPHAFEEGQPVWVEDGEGNRHAGIFV